jgi:DNA-binding XRE family transcriptional regulator
MNAQMIYSDGKPEFAVLPFDEYRKLLQALEDARDVACIDDFRRKVAEGKEELVPSAIVDRLLEGEHPVKVWREYRGLTLRSLAKVCGVSDSAISQIERAKNAPSARLLRKLAGALRIDMEALLPAE